jgi:pimeloyl-ACP methyl ester carboxylesterase
MSNADIDHLHALTFGAPGRRLFGIFHRADPARRNAGGVLLCSAFGQEAVRSHRLVRVLGEQLAKRGHDVLRFDYFGTGDSMGEDSEGDLDGWAADVVTADAELRRLGLASAVTWLGIRLGAAVALRAARRASLPPSRLVLFDAVVDGRRYLTSLRERHVATLEEAFSVVPRPPPRTLARNPGRYLDEALGFALPPTLRSQIASLSLASLEWPLAADAIVALVDPGDADGRDLAAAALQPAARFRALEVRHGTDWMRDSAEQSSLVPAQALQALVRQVGHAS